MTFNDLMVKWLAMKQFKKICIMLVIALFAMQTTASVALAACNCPNMQDQAMQMDDASGDMPCHGMDKADAQSDTSPDDKQMVDCDKCGCGHCTVTSTAALSSQLSSNQLISSNMVALPASDFMKSLFPFGIDYPPKRIS